MRWREETWWQAGSILIILKTLLACDDLQRNVKSIPYLEGLILERPVLVANGYYVLVLGAFQQLSSQHYVLGYRWVIHSGSSATALLLHALERV